MVWAQVLQASVPVMMTEGGSIVLATAAISHMGAANHDIVAAAKGAVSSLAVSAASTYSAHNIR
jgi:3-oxoacyl-[acyl-carrier protein] reductase